MEIIESILAILVILSVARIFMNVESKITSINK